MQIRSPNGASYLRKDRLCRLRNGAAKLRERHGRVKLIDVSEIVVVEKLLRVQSAPPHKRIVQTVCHKLSESDFEIQIVHFLKEAPLHRIGEGFKIIRKILSYRRLRHTIEAVRKARRIFNAVLGFEMLRDRLSVLRAQIP